MRQLIVVVAIATGLVASLAGAAMAGIDTSPVVPPGKGVVVGR